MKTKFLIPVMAAIFAIGMSFTTVSTQNDPAMDYVLTDSGVVQIQEINCGSGSIGCEARLAPGGEPYPVYNDPNLQTRKIGNGKVVNAF